jgi:hypothetical protein
MDGREVKALPGRARVDGVKDWKWMFRISSNWRTGKHNMLSAGCQGCASNSPQVAATSSVLRNQSTSIGSWLAGSLRSRRTSSSLDRLS